MDKGSKKRATGKTAATGEGVDIGDAWRPGDFDASSMDEPAAALRMTPGAPDLVSEIFEVLQLHAFGSRSIIVPAGAGIRFPARNEILARPPRHIVGPHRFLNRPPDGIIHILTQGQAELRVDGQPGVITLAPGDLVLVLHGHGHQIQDDETATLQPIWNWLEKNDHNSLASPSDCWGVIGGVVHCLSPAAARIVKLLPPIVHIPSQQRKSPMWMDELLRVIMSEGTSPVLGSSAVANRVIHLFFILAVRACLSAMAAPQRNWLGAFLDPEMGAALALIHARPEHPWTVSTLAEEVSMSRSAFAAKFVERVGLPPLQYLTQRRMEAARIMLEDHERSVKQVAKAVGYLSVAAFASAFRRFEGVYPSAYRRQWIDRRADKR